MTYLRPAIIALLALAALGAAGVAASSVAFEPQQRFGALQALFEPAEGPEESSEASPQD